MVFELILNINEQPFRICYWGTFESNYARNRVVLQGLKNAGYKVFICHEPFWEQTLDKTSGFKGLSIKIRICLKLLFKYFKLFIRYLHVPKHDIIWVGYIGHFDIFLASFLGLIFRRLVIFDAFISLYDSTVKDRKIIREGSWKAWLLFQLDKWSCRLSSAVLTDTAQHVDYFQMEFGINKTKLFCVPVGADTDYYTATIDKDKYRINTITKVLHYGKFTPLHGLPYLIGAASILKNYTKDILFVLVGEGQEKENIEMMAKQDNLVNIEFLPFVTQKELAKIINDSDICLGIFGDSEKAKRVIPNKVYQCMAIGKPIITGRTPAIERYLTHLKDVYLCNMADSESLAEAILSLHNEPLLRKRLALQSRQTFLTYFSFQQLGVRLHKIIQTVYAQRR